MDTLEQTLETIVLMLPNFAGLVYALYIMTRQNQKLTDTLVDLTTRCDCKDKEEA